jgi:hypothetical protein
MNLFLVKAGEERNKLYILKKYKLDLSVMKISLNSFEERMKKIKNYITVKIKVLII